MKLEYTNSLMKITGSNQADSHIGGKAADLSSSIGGLRAFADIKVVKILSKGKYNTVFFTTVNEVETPVGTDFVSFKCAHMSDTDYADLGIKIGKTFSKGHICYKSGDLGSPKNFHIHIEFGLGSVKELGHIGVPPNNNYTIQTTRGSIEIYEALFISEGTAFESGNTPADNYTWVSTPSDIGDTGLFLRTSQSSVRIRKSPVTGAYKVTVPLNRDIPIVNFNNKFERDGYQWAAVKYGNEEGFCQIDTKHCYTIKGSAQRLYIYTASTSLRIRDGYVTGKQRVLVPSNQMIKVISLTPGIQSDGYQWAKVCWSGFEGFSQIDTKNWSLLRVN